MVHAAVLAAVCFLAAVQLGTVVEAQAAPSALQTAVQAAAEAFEAYEAQPDTVAARPSGVSGSYKHTCTYLMYKTNKCPYQKPPHRINYWDLLVQNPAGKPDAPQVHADPCQGVVCPNVVSVDQSNFPAHRLGPITFTEVNLGTLNPVYSPGDYPGGSSDPRAPTVRFAATFLGQSVAGTAITGRPTAPLTLNTTPGSQQAEVVFGDVTRTQELENADALGQPLAIRFSTPIAAVGLEVGFLRASPPGVEVAAYDALGNILLALQNEFLGNPFFGFETDDGSALIAGLLIQGVAAGSGENFAIDNVVFVPGNSRVTDSCCV